MSIKVEGVDRIQKRITNAAGRIDDETVKILRRAAVRVRRRQKELAPEDDGDLRRAIRYRIRGRRWRRRALVGPVMDERYPMFQEYGTKHMEANPYIQPSIEGEHERIAEELNRYLTGAL